MKPRLIIIILLIGICTFYSQPFNAFEHCYKFNFHLRSHGHKSDTLSPSSTSISYEFLNCGDTPLIFSSDNGAYFEKYNGLFLYFYKIIHSDTLPYCTYLDNPKDDAEGIDNKDTLLPGKRKTFKECCKNILFYKVDSGEYLIKAALKRKLDDNNGYYYQESENTLHVLIKEDD